MHNKPMMELVRVVIPDRDNCRFQETKEFKYKDATDLNESFYVPFNIHKIVQR